MKVVLSGPVKGVCKSYALWVVYGTKNTPIAYLRKPKWVTNEAWVKFISGLSMSLSGEGQAALNEMLESSVLDREVSND